MSKRATLTIVRPEAGSPFAGEAEHFMRLQSANGVNPTKDYSGEFCAIAQLAFDGQKVEAQRRASALRESLNLAAADYLSDRLYHYIGGGGKAVR